MKTALFLLGAFAVCVIAAALVDVVPAARTWLLRIGIGSLPPEKAREAMCKKTLRWLRKMPAVPISDQTRFTLPERLRGTYKSRKVQSWQLAALMLGAGQAGQREALQAVQDRLLTGDGAWKQPVDRPDIALLAYALLRFAPDTDAVRPAMDAVYAFLCAQADGGTVPYDPRTTNKRFVDTVGMICPFLSLYAKTYDAPEAAALALRQLEEYTRLGLHPATGLPSHAIRVPDGAPLGVYGWGRGCGWYALALSEMLRCGVSEALEPAAAYARAVMACQQPNGAWSRQLLAEAGGETSGTAMLGHLLAQLYFRTGEEKLRISAQKAERFLYTAVRTNGEVDYAQGDTKGVGFYSARMTPSPAALGFALLLSEELNT
ncbi:MAG: glycoside hydrolase family 88 protein [Clostridia bacterium]|nr:glycoside hydrolase family 88 protein [Clostridia bacterium]